jgi:hypothetical protein
MVLLRHIGDSTEKVYSKPGAISSSSMLLGTRAGRFVEEFVASETAL